MLNLYWFAVEELGMSTVREVRAPGLRSEICREILRDLPDWFGRPEAAEAYVDAVSALTTFVWEAKEGPVGFAAVSQPTVDACDIHVMGVSRRYHGRGVGRALFLACEDAARIAGTRFLTVQTLGPSASDPHYARTRAFYKACGMAAIAEFPGHWGANAPMLLMGKELGPGSVTQLVNRTSIPVG